MNGERIPQVNIDPKLLCPPGNPEWRTGHHFRIQSPNGENSTGVCKKCDYTRPFKNYAPPEEWGKLRKEAARNGLAGVLRQAAIMDPIHPSLIDG